jgi:hypothetical protein
MFGLSTLVNFSGAVRGRVIFIANGRIRNVLSALVVLPSWYRRPLPIPHWGALGGGRTIVFGVVVNIPSLIFTETISSAACNWRLFFPSLSFWKLPA